MFQMELETFLFSKTICMNNSIQKIEDYLPVDFRDLSEYVIRIDAESVTFRFPTDIQMNFDKDKINKHFKGFSFVNASFWTGDVVLFFKEKLKWPNDVAYISFTNSETLGRIKVVHSIPKIIETPPEDDGRPWDNSFRIDLK